MVFSQYAEILHINFFGSTITDLFCESIQEVFECFTLPQTFRTLVFTDSLNEIRFDDFFLHSFFKVWF